MKAHAVAGFLAVGVGSAVLLSAQSAPFELNTMYVCPSVGQSIQIFSCTGTRDTDTCDVQSYSGGQPLMRGPSTRQQVMTVMSICRKPTAAELQAARGRAGAPAPAPQASAAGIKVGDKVSISMLVGWTEAVVTAIAGDNYQVRVPNGTVVMKTYPAELRRIGPPTAYDRSRGIYEAGDKVEVLFEGKWVPTKIETTLGMEYQVNLPGNRTGWAKPADLRFVAPAPPKTGATAGATASAAAKPGQPPRAGLTSCAGKIEGRYAASNGMPYTMEFRSGKVTITAPLMGGEDAECWMSGKKIYLHKAGEPDDIPLDINDDGTLQTPFGELKKKGS